MKYITKNLFVFGLVLALFFVQCNETPKEPVVEGSKVELRQIEDGRYRLFVNDKEFYVKGAGLEHGDIPSLAAHGGNSFRTWRTDNGKHSAKEVLDEAEANGLMVLMGIEIGRERHGFDYNDTIWVRSQFESVKKQVLALKDHPALLGWAIGNELNLHSSNPKVWEAVNDISKMIHEVDGNHPTTTTFAGFTTKDAESYMTYCTDLDFVSIQMYGAIIKLQEYLKESGYKGPYMVTEWGATGHWEMPTTEWGIPIEQTGTEKAAAVRERWVKAIAVDKKKCLGSYVFLWGQKQERTPTWYGLFTERGNEIEVIDVMHELWTGKAPENRCPTLDSLSLNGEGRFDNIHLKPNSENKLYIGASDPDMDSMELLVEVIPDNPEGYGDGGDFEKRPKSTESTEHMAYQSDFTFACPQEEGPYRVFVYITDGNKNVATGNIPFFVKK